MQGRGDKGVKYSDTSPLRDQHLAPRNIPSLVLTLVLGLVPVFARADTITMPGWFWQQSSAGFLGHNLVVNTVIGSGYRVFCWQVGQAFAGIAIKADKAVGDVQVADLIEVRPAYCQMILKATNGR